MAVKSVVVSDLTGKEIPEGHAVTMVIHEHPALEGRPVELDIEAEQAEKFQTKRLDMVNITIEGRRVVMDTAAFNAMFKGKDISEVIQSARRAEVSVAPRRGRGAAKKPAGERVNYATLEHCGELHRGRITEEEAALVRDNQDKASANRQRQTGNPIDFTDAKEKSRYGL